MTSGGFVMPLTLNDLASTPELRSRIVCSPGAANGVVSWAHVCELADPTEWLGKGDLLMTTGIGIPVEAESQRAYIRRLQKGGVAGLMIGDNMKAPPDLEALMSEADKLGFPVLMTDYGVPFSAVTKAVMEAYKQREHERRTSITKVYETARLSIQGIGLPRLLSSLGKDVGAALHLVDPASLLPWMAGLEELPESHHNALMLRPRAASGAPIIQRCSIAQGETVLMSVPAHRGALLAAHSAQALDYGLLHHMVAVIGIELERLRVERETRLRLGSELIDDLLHKRVLPPQAHSRLVACGGSPSRLRIAVSGMDSISVSDIDAFLVQSGIDLILRVQGEEVIFLTWDESTLYRIQSRFNIKIGVSEQFEYVDDYSNALREARLALIHANENCPVRRYSDSSGNSPWLPQSLHDAAEAFREVLGALAEYDRAQNSQLLYTLRVFLANNRSWVAAAQKLHIHKQTLVYRVRRIEEITGRSLDSTEDVAIFWFALKSGDLTDTVCGANSVGSEQSGYLVGLVG